MEGEIEVVPPMKPKEADAAIKTWLEQNDVNPEEYDLRQEIIRGFDGTTIHRYVIVPRRTGTKGA